MGKLIAIANDLFARYSVLFSGWDQSCRSVKTASSSSGFSFGNILLSSALLREKSLKLNLRTERKW